MNNKPYLLALNRINAIGSRTIQKLLHRWPALKDLFSLSLVDLEEAGLPKKMAMAIHQFNLNTVDADFQWEKKSNHHLITWDDAAYPPCLKEIHDPPAVLYAVGDPGCLQQTALAIVGTRKPSVSGRETAWHFAHQLAAHPVTIISGLAYGIDAEAHAGCLAAKGRTIAVMGTGIDRVYPHAHLRLAAQITENGLLLTEFPLNSAPTAGHFPRRNRIISGLSLATLVVEAAIKSGSLITARLALEQNRDVLAIPGSIHNLQATGCHHLLQQGAKLVTSIQDVLEELRIESHAKKGKESGVALGTSNKNLVQCVGFEITTIDQIMQRSGLCVEQVACNLAQLELQGLVQAVPGGYTRCASDRSRVTI